MLAVDRSLVREVSGPREANDATLTELGENPGYVVFPDLRGPRRMIAPGPGVREPELSVPGLEGPDGSPVDTQDLHQAPERGPDLLVGVLRGRNSEDA